MGCVELRPAAETAAGLFRTPKPPHRVDAAGVRCVVALVLPLIFSAAPLVLAAGHFPSIFHYLSLYLRLFFTCIRLAILFAAPFVPPRPTRGRTDDNRGKGQRRQRDRPELGLFCANPKTVERTQILNVKVVLPKG